MPMRNMHLLSALRDHGQETFRSLFAEGAEPEFEHRGVKAKALGTLQQYYTP